MDATSDATGIVATQALIPGGGYDWNIPGVPLLGGQTAGERGQRRHFSPAWSQPRSAILRQHKPGVRDRHVRRRADGQPAGCDASQTFARSPVAGCG